MPSTSHSGGISNCLPILILRVPVNVMKAKGGYKEMDFQAEDVPCNIHDGKLENAPDFN
jgi:hypothetical protein